MAFLRMHCLNHIPLDLNSAVFGTVGGANRLRTAPVSEQDRRRTTPNIHQKGYIFSTEKLYSSIFTWRNVQYSIQKYKRHGVRRTVVMKGNYATLGQEHQTSRDYGIRFHAYEYISRVCWSVTYVHQCSKHIIGSCRFYESSTKVHCPSLASSPG